VVRVRDSKEVSVSTLENTKTRIARITLLDWDWKLKSVQDKSIWANQLMNVNIFKGI